MDDVTLYQVFANGRVQVWHVMDGMLVTYDVPPTFALPPDHQRPEDETVTRRIDKEKRLILVDIGPVRSRRVVFRSQSEDDTYRQTVLNRWENDEFWTQNENMAEQIWLSLQIGRGLPEKPTFYCLRTSGEICVLKERDGSLIGGTHPWFISLFSERDDEELARYRASESSRRLLDRSGNLIFETQVKNGEELRITNLDRWENDEFWTTDQYTAEAVREGLARGFEGLLFPPRPVGDR